MPVSGGVIVGREFALQEAELAAHASELLNNSSKSALAKLDDVRSQLWSEGKWKCAFVAEPVCEAPPFIRRLVTSSL